MKPIFQWQLPWVEKWHKLLEENYTEEGGYDWNTIAPEFSLYVKDRNREWQKSCRKQFKK